jgi:hypothetical protein
MADDNKVVDFPSTEISDEERARRTMKEVERLVRLSPGEWKFWCKKSAATLGITPEMLSDLVETKLKDIKATERAADTEKRRQDDRAERQRTSAERDETRKRERDQRDITKATARKADEKHRAFVDLAKLPADRHEAKLTELATRLGEDVATLREEFSDYADTAADETAAAAPSAGEWHVEPWSDPVQTAALLRDVTAKIDQHFAARPHETLTVAPRPDRNHLGGDRHAAPFRSQQCLGRLRGRPDHAAAGC